MESPTEPIKNNTPEIPDILSLDPDYVANFKPYIQRYFKEMYCTAFNTDTQKCDTCIRIHNNGLCLVYLADNHSIIKENKCIKNLNFKINNNLDRTKNKFSGKRKKGAQVVKSSSLICHIECEDSSSYPVYAGVPGRLLEVNPQSISDPQIIVNQRNAYGYLCIILPDGKQSDKYVDVLSPDQYCQT